ncbi:MAG: helix-turn-helix transcriptional regulator [Anaerolinea sp.]|jgi:AraC-like DNA-binding protein|nr:helix-turn-helix transcriptional regulator [Anaerolinea sp.]
MKYKLVAIPEILQQHVELIAVAEHNGETNLTTNVYLNALPGIVFQHNNGCSPIANITTSSSYRADTPTLFVYGQMTEPSIVSYRKGPFTTMQIFLKPHALQTLFGVNAAALTNHWVELREFSAGDLNMQLLEAKNEQARLTLLTDFLTSKLKQATTCDQLIEESLRIIHTNVGRVTVRYLFECLNLSERQFEKRFSQTVGLTPQFYIRVKRFNEAVRLMQTRQFEKFTDLAHHLNFYDQSHFIRDIKAFSGVTPKSLFRCYTKQSFRKLDFHPGQ